MTVAAERAARVSSTSDGHNGWWYYAGMELGFHLLRRACYDEEVISEVARVME